MDKRIFEKVLHEKGKKIALSCIKSLIEYYIFCMVLGIVVIMLTGIIIIDIVGFILGLGIAGIIAFVVIFLREVHNESKK